MRYSLATVVLACLAAAAAAHEWEGLARNAAGDLFAIDAEDDQVWRVDGRGRVSVFLAGRTKPPILHAHHLAFDAEGVLWLPSG